MIKYVIFDMDGTLVDTETMFRESWIITSNKYGLEDPEILYESIVGTPSYRLKEILRETYGDRVDPEAFYAERTECTIRLFEERGIPKKTGCSELLEFLREHNIPCAIATSTPLYISGRNAERAGVKELVRDIVTSEMVEHGKPAPDIFIEAGRRIGAVPQETVVVEDSINGLRGAHAAGMMPVWVFDRQIPDGETRKMLFAECKSLFDLIEIIKKENKI